MAEIPISDKPHRVQLRRVLGWKMPANTMKVSRPSPFGNPFKIGEMYQIAGADDGTIADVVISDAGVAVAFFRQWVGRGLGDAAIQSLRGKNLACWCPLDQPCHADVLLEMANG